MIASSRYASPEGRIGKEVAKEAVPLDHNTRHRIPPDRLLSIDRTHNKKGETITIST